MKRILMAGAAYAALGAAPCAAQIIDYGQLQEIFGEPITASATGSPQKAAEAPVAMQIITQDEIRRSGADNIPDILQFVAGIDVSRYGASDADVGIRGYNSANSPRVLVLLNGRQLYIDFHSYTAWAILPVQLEEIRQIEVIKGPNTALFGFNAVAGVINIVTLDPIADPINEVTARIGSQHDQQISAVASGRWNDQAGLRLSASEHGIHEASTAEVPQSFGPYSPDNFNRSVYAHGRAVLPGGIDLTAEADSVEAKQFEMTVGGYPGDTSYAANHQKIDIGAATGLGYLNLNAYRNEVAFHYWPGENCITCVGIDNSLYVVQASDLLKPDIDHTLRFGVEYRDNRGGGSAYSGETLGFDVYAANIMWSWQATPKLALTNSARIDHMTFTYKGAVPQGVLFDIAQYNRKPLTEPSFNSALVYAATAADTVRLSVSRGVQTPDFYALYPQPVSADPAFTVGTVKAFEGSPNLKPTLITNYEADYDRSLAGIGSTAQFSLFYQTSRDLLGPPGDANVTDPVTDFGYSGNIGRSESVGGELSLKGSNSAGWRWKLAYALDLIFDHTSVNADPANPDSSIDNERGNPKHAVTAAFGRSWGDWEADLSARWQSSFDDITIGAAGDALQRYHIKDYLIANGRVGYSLSERVLLGLSVQQLNQARLTAASGTPLDRRVTGSATFRF